MIIVFTKDLQIIEVERVGLYAIDKSTTLEIQQEPLGEGALKSSTMLKRINAGRHEEVPGQMKRWTRAGGKVLKGLERHREAEAALYRMRWY